MEKVKERTKDECVSYIRTIMLNAMVKELLQTNNIDLETYHKMCKRINKLKGG